MKDKFNKIIRVVTIPPVIVTTLLITFIYYGVITSLVDKILLILFLGIIPILSYPFNKLLKGKREDERKLAFIFTIVSYTLGFIYAYIFSDVKEIKFIYYIYFISSIILTIFNLFKIKASGHIASVTGFVLLLYLFINKYTLLITIPIYLLVGYSSLSLKRHKVIDLLFGTLSILLAYGVSYLLI